MTKIVLHGALGAAVGRDTWNLKVKTPGEALRAIEANTGKLFRHLSTNENGYAEYRVLLDGEDFTSESELVNPRVKLPKTIHFVPVVKGSGSNGGWLIAIGVILMVAAVVLAPYTGGTSIAAAGSLSGSLSGSLVATTAFTLGLSLVVGGIAQLVIGTPKIESNERPENKPSDMFNGAINTYRQGNPVPVGYGGPLRVGSAVISASIRVLNLPSQVT